MKDSMKNRKCNRSSCLCLLPQIVHHQKQSSLKQMYGTCTKNNIREFTDKLISSLQSMKFLMYLTQCQYLHPFLIFLPWSTVLGTLVDKITAWLYLFKTRLTSSHESGFCLFCLIKTKQCSSYKIHRSEDISSLISIAKRPHYIVNYYGSLHALQHTCRARFPCP